MTAELAPTPSEMSTDDVAEPDPRGVDTVAPNASAPTAQHGPQTVGSGIRPVLTPASDSNWLQSSPPVILLMLAAVTLASFYEVFIF